jgi:1,4-alpha-glucan branching enzyme
MNKTNKPLTMTAKPPAPILRPSLATAAKTVSQATLEKTKSQPLQTQAARRKIRFEVDAPRAWSVVLVGTFNGWKPGATPLNRIDGGNWAGELFLAPGRYEYRLVVDGHWVDDPKAKAYVPNPHGGRNALLQVE